MLLFLLPGGPKFSATSGERGEGGDGYPSPSSSHLRSVAPRIFQPVTTRRMCGTVWTSLRYRSECFYYCFVARNRQLRHLYATLLASGTLDPSAGVRVESGHQSLLRRGGAAVHTPDRVPKRGPVHTCVPPFLAGPYEAFFVAESTPMYGKREHLPVLCYMILRV